MTDPSYALSRRLWLRGLLAPLLATGAAARSAPALGLAAPSAAPLLASVYTGQVDPALCLISEKFDGVRALWDGRVLRHRSGRPVAAPTSFVENLPGVGLDGELWLGRGRFDAVSTIVRRTEPRPAEWALLRYMVFEMPDAGGSFAERAALIEQVAARSPSSQLVAVTQSRGVDRAGLQRQLDATVAAGGEGLMLHVASAPVGHGRNDALMKLKPHLDAEAVVVGYRPGAGKYGELVGSLAVRSADGRHFFVGSGLSDALRRQPPRLGELITYRYRDLTSTGLPRFATYLRRAEAL
ncbi:MAG: DNA ligase [Pseudomonadota bacterium]|nr:DNA ligase [Pseudomonadota bacterium]